MNPGIATALPGAPRAASSNAAGTSGFVAEPSVDDASAAANESGDGGFAAALDQAGGERDAWAEASAASSDTNPASPEAGVSASGSMTSKDPAPASSATTDGRSSPVDPSPLAGAALPNVRAPADAATGASAAPGWPPPGLSSLFPAQPLFGAGAAATTGRATLPLSSGLAPGASAPTTAASGTATPGAANAASTADPSAAARASGRGNVLGRFALSADAIALPADPLGPRGPEAPITAPSPLAAPSAALASATSHAALAPALAPNDALALALSRQPAPLRLTSLEGRDAELDAIATLTDLVAPERLPDGALPLPSATGPAMPRLDLAQAFPAPVPLPSRHFAEDVGARLQWIAEQQGGEATLRISPDGLGPVEVRLKLDGDRVELGFSAAHTETRQALQDALPKLREMLAQQGLQLGHADVGHRHAGASRDGEANGARRGGDDGDAAPVALTPSARQATLVIGRGGRGVLDLYA